MPTKMKSIGTISDTLFFIRLLFACREGALVLHASLPAGLSLLRRQPGSPLYTKAQEESQSLHSAAWGRARPRSPTHCLPRRARASRAIGGDSCGIPLDGGT